MLFILPYQSSLQGSEYYSKMRLSRQFEACLFFYGKILHAQKHSQANINQQNKIKETLNN